MHLYLVRHAESANNHLYATTGSSAGRQNRTPSEERRQQRDKAHQATTMQQITILVGCHDSNTSKPTLPIQRTKGN